MKLNRRPESGHQDVIIIEPTNGDPDADGQGVLWGWEGLDGSFHPFHSSTPRPSPCLSYLLLQGGPPPLTIASWTGRPPCARLCPFGSGAWGIGFRLRHRSPERQVLGEGALVHVYSLGERQLIVSQHKAPGQVLSQKEQNPLLDPWERPCPISHREKPGSPPGAPDLRCSHPCPIPRFLPTIYRLPPSVPQESAQIPPSNPVLFLWGPEPLVPRSVALSSCRDGHTLWEWRPCSGQLHKGAA